MIQQKTIRNLDFSKKMNMAINSSKYFVTKRDRWQEPFILQTKPIYGVSNYERETK